MDDLYRKICLTVCWLLFLLFFFVQWAGAGYWVVCPYQKDFDFSGRRLQECWSVLHADDQEPFPSVKWVQELLHREPEIRAHLPYGCTSPEELALKMQDAWRLYHEGRFQESCELGSSLGPIGSYVAGRAMAIHNFYLAPVQQREQRFQEQLRRIEQDLKALEQEKGGPIDYPNFYFGLAYVAGRYSQASSILTAVRHGLAGRIKELLDRTLETNPGHQGAWISKGSFQAELVSKVGGLLSRLTYGASAKGAIADYEKALALNPDSLIARVEYAHGLLVLDARGNLQKARALLQETLNMSPADVFGRLVQERARKMLDKLQAGGQDK